MKEQNKKQKTKKKRRENRKKETYGFSAVALRSEFW
jgi:hypothetical protein